VNDITADVIAWLAPRFDEMEALLHRLVDIDSNSFDKAGTDAVGAAITEVLQADDIAIDRMPKSGFGDVLRAEVPGRQANSYALLLGHRDTVFKTGTVATRGYSRKDDLAFGPGVCDMKAGLVANIFALRAIKAAGGLPFPVVALFTADEEIGSPTGRAEIENAARGARAVFNTEPGRVSGNVVTGRKGGATFHITVKGRAAHSGANHQDGASAIEALARKIVRLHALTDYDAGITTNVGVIKGGNTHNTVAPWAEAELDLRFVTFAQHAAPAPCSTPSRAELAATSSPPARAAARSTSRSPAAPRIPASPTRMAPVPSKRSRARSCACTR